jgi:hypothetical protein
MFSNRSTFCVLENRESEDPLLDHAVREKILYFIKKRFSHSPYEYADYLLRYSYGITPPQTHSRKLKGEGTGSDFFPRSREVYERKLELQVILGTSFRQMGRREIRWCGQVSSWGTGPDPFAVIPFLSIGAFEVFGTQTPQAVRMSIYEDDPRVLPARIRRV